MKQLHFNRKQLLRAIYLAAVAIALSFTSSAQAQIVVPTSVNAPYSADLTNGGSFTTTGSSVSGYKAGESASSAPSAAGFQQTAVSAGFYSTVNGASTTVSNLGGATPSNFIETADMTLSSFSGFSGSMGLFALSGGTTVSAYKGAAGLGYLGGMNITTGQISLGAQVTPGGIGSNFGVNGPSLTFNAADTYHFELDGSYGAGNDLTLTLTVTDLSNSLNTATLTADMGLLTGGLPTLPGQNFGTQVGSVFASATGTVSNFSVDLAAVPEPSDYALMLLGGAALLGIARRRKNATA